MLLCGVLAGYTGVLERVTPEAPNDQGLTNSCLNVSSSDACCYTS
jgi:hypothetical protein